MLFFICFIVKGISNKVMSGFVQLNVDKYLILIEKSLQGKEWFVGEWLMGVDIQMIFFIEVVVVCNMFVNKYLVM